MSNSSAFTPTVVASSISVVVPGVSSGLVSASGLPGRTDGGTVAANFVGQVIQSIASTGTGAENTGIYKQITSVVLTAGRWLVDYKVWIDGNGAVGWAGSTSTVALSTTTASAAGTVNTTTFQYIANGSVNNQVVNVSGQVVLDLASTTTYYLNVQTPSTTGSPQLYGNIIAKRIA